jgi:hypothetical protein
MPDRRDLFGECNADGHPVDVFIRECCSSCFNRECTRSLSGKAKFDHRVSTWFERYFGDQDKMNPADPRYPMISAQKFIFIDPGRRTPEVSSAWIDPRDLGSSQPTAQVVSSSEPSVETPPPTVKEKPVRNIPHHLILANVPQQQGRMLERPPSASVAAPKDPWAGPVVETKEDAPVVSPGARVKIGVDGTGQV